MSENELRIPRGSAGGGRWTSGGAAEPIADPRALDVGGDEWNKQTATRLEKEYAAVRPDLDKLAQEATKEVPQRTEAEVRAEELAHETPNFHDLENKLKPLETAALIGKYGSIQAASTALYGKDVPGLKGTDEPNEEEEKSTSPRHGTS